MNAIPDQTPGPWDRIEGETELAYEAFVQFLQLPKKGNPPRRYQVDLAAQRGITPATINKWAKGWNWEERAKAYDIRFDCQITPIQEAEDRKRFSADLHRAGKTMREKALAAIVLLTPERLAQMSVDELVKLHREGVRCEEMAEKLEKPVEEDKRAQLVAQIRDVVQLATGKFAAGQSGESAGGGSRGTIEAVERTVRLRLDGQSGDEPVRTIPALPGEVREGRAGGEPVE